MQEGEIMDLIEIYVEKRLRELDDMINVYDEAGEEPTVDLLARRQELERLATKFEEWSEVEKAETVAKI